MQFLRVRCVFYYVEIHMMAQYNSIGCRLCELLTKSEECATINLLTSQQTQRYTIQLGRERL